MPNFGDDLILGQALTGIVAPAGGTGQEPNSGRGVGPLGRIYTYDIVPLTLSTSNIGKVAAAATAGVPVAGTGTTSVVNARGETVVQADVPRAIKVTGTNASDTMVVTIIGYDFYGVKMSEAVTANGNGNVNTKKAFYQVLSFSAASAANADINLGFTDVFGLPYALCDLGAIISVKWDGAILQNTATVVAAVTTDPATTTTGDTRGTVAQSGNASNGTRRLFVHMFIPRLAFLRGNRTDAMGVDQNLASS